jgi:hypothetical protein
MWANDGGVGMAQGGGVENEGLFEVYGDGNMFWTLLGASGSFNNRGTLVKYGADRATSFSALSFTNRGIVEVRRGTLSFGNYNQASGITRLLGGNLSASYNVNLIGGRLLGQGVLAGNIVIDGATIDLGGLLGTLNILGRLGLSSDVLCQIKGAAASNLFDRIQISSGSHLGGTLHVCVQGYRPLPGEAFEVVKFSSHAGGFQKITGLDLGGGLSLTPVYTATNLTLVATQGPAERDSLSLKPCGLDHLHLRFLGEPNRSYAVQATSNLVDWLDLVVTNTPNGAIEFADEDYHRNGDRIFRVIRGP